MVEDKDTARKAVCKCGRKIRGDYESCSTCRIKQKADKQRAIAEARRKLLRERKCKICGKQLNTTDKRKVVCSNECNWKVRVQEKTLVACAVCGKEVVRYAKNVERFKASCCSDKCQKTWAGRCGKGRKVDVDWELRSSKAKQKWKRHSHLQRKVNSRKHQWLCQIIDRRNRILHSRVEYTKRMSPGLELWLYRIRTRLGSGKGRRNKCKSSLAGSVTIEEALSHIHRKRKWHNLNPWIKKLTNKLSNAKHRRRRKNEIKQGKNGGAIQQDRAKWIQVCFNWMEH